MAHRVSQNNLLFQFAIFIGVFLTAFESRTVVSGEWSVLIHMLQAHGKNYFCITFISKMRKKLALLHIGKIFISAAPYARQTIISMLLVKLWCIYIYLNSYGRSSAHVASYQNQFLVSNFSFNCTDNNRQVLYIYQFLTYITILFGPKKKRNLF